MRTLEFIWDVPGSGPVWLYLSIYGMGCELWDRREKLVFYSNRNMNQLLSPFPAQAKVFVLIPKLKPWAPLLMFATPVLWEIR